MQPDLQAQLRSLLGLLKTLPLDFAKLARIRAADSEDEDDVAFDNLKLRYLRNVVTNGTSEQKLNLLQQLVAAGDPSILQLHRCRLSDTEERARRMEISLAKLGLLPITANKAFIYSRFAQGLSGTQRFLQLVEGLARITKVMRKHAKGPQFMHAELVDDLISNWKQLVNSKPQIFPITFPERFEERQDSQLKEMKDQLLNMLEHSSGCERVQVKIPTQQELDAYQKELRRFLANVGQSTRIQVPSRERETSRRLNFTRELAEGLREFSAFQPLFRLS